jgi:hypothetical protein
VLPGVNVALGAFSFPLAATVHQLDWSGSNNLVLGVSFSVVGFVVAARQPRNPMGWILLGASTLLVVSGNACTRCSTTGHGTLPLGPMAVLLQPTWAPAERAPGGGQPVGRAPSTPQCGSASVSPGETLT